jgi:GTP-binding protein
LFVARKAHSLRMSGLIAIVGRPNVGKSALFNRIAGRRIAIVHDMPGVTRDRISAEVEWHGRPFTLVDTGGIGLLRREKSLDAIISAAIQQVDLAIESANVIVLVVNVQEGIMPLDQEVAMRLRKCGKPVIVAINKVDTSKAEPGVPEFARLGFEKSIPVSAIHGGGMDALMDEALRHLPEASDAGRVTSDEKETDDIAGEIPPPVTRPASPLKLAIVGRPNVGKSSIINALTQSERVIVSPIPGTTRDAVDVPFEVETEGVRQKYILIDTAGMRKSRRVDDTVEFFSVQRSENSIDRADIVVMVLDAEMGVTEQDKKIGDRIVEARKACIIVVNKWDLMAEGVRKAQVEEMLARKKKDHHRPKNLVMLSEFGQWVQEKLFFIDYAPVIFTSAKSGFQLERLLEAVRYVAAQLQQQIPTSLLNRAINDAVEKRQPVSDAGHRLKFFYATQVKQSPPTFVLFVNRDELFSDQYKKYLGNELRTAFGYEGCPMILVPRARPKTIEPKRKFRPANQGQAARLDQFTAARRAKYSRKPAARRGAGNAAAKGPRSHRTG